MNFVNSTVNVSGNATFSVRTNCAHGQHAAAATSSSTANFISLLGALSQGGSVTLSPATNPSSNFTPQASDRYQDPRGENGSSKQGAKVSAASTNMRQFAAFLTAFSTTDRLAQPTPSEGVLPQTEGSGPKMPTIRRSNSNVISHQAAASSSSQADVVAKSVAPNPHHVVPQSWNNPDHHLALSAVQLQNLKSFHVQRKEAYHQMLSKRAKRQREHYVFASSASVMAAAHEALAKSAVAAQTVAQQMTRQEQQIDQEFQARKRQRRLTLQERTMIWTNYNGINGRPMTIERIAQFMCKNTNTVHSALRRMQKRASEGLPPLDSPPRGGQNPASRRKPVFTEEHLLYAGRWLVVNNKARYRDAVEALKRQFPVLQDVETDRATKALQKTMSSRLGFRSSDFMTVPAQRNLPDVILKRQQYVHLVLGLEGYEDAIFIDETGFNAAVVPSKGLSLEGCRPMLDCRNMSLNNVSVIAAVNRKGLVFYECFIGGVNGATFALFLQHLLDYMQQNGLIQDDGSPQTLIMDNCSVHKENRNVMTLLENNKHIFSVLYLPPYSPFLDPCEEIFSIWKKLFCDLLIHHQATKEAGLVHLICLAATKITARHGAGAWTHCKRFFNDCLQGKAISTKQILDGVHPGDEKEKTIMDLYRSWGLQYRRFDVDVEEGTVPEVSQVLLPASSAQPLVPSGNIHGFIPGSQEIHIGRHAGNDTVSSDSSSQENNDNETDEDE